LATRFCLHDDSAKRPIGYLKVNKKVSLYVAQLHIPSSLLHTNKGDVFQTRLDRRFCSFFDVCLFH
jgi:Leu/Phe-tRNA-protein transferase